jgi:hypothetical protein
VAVLLKHSLRKPIDIDLRGGSHLVLPSQILPLAVRRSHL